jgi:hypothetical protein
MSSRTRAIVVAMLALPLAACGAPALIRDGGSAVGTVAIPVEADAVGVYAGHVCRYGYLPVQACTTMQLGYVGGACRCPSVDGGTFYGRIAQR